MAMASTAPRRRSFSREEIRRFIPLLQTLTEAAERELDELLAGLDGEPAHTDSERSIVGAVDRRVARWFDDVAALGGAARGLWLVEFPGEAGWLGWQPGAVDVIAFRPFGSPPEARSALH